MPRKHNIHLRRRLHEYALQHNRKIDVEAFVREAIDDADFGLFEPVSLNHTWQTLARWPEFIKESPGFYRYVPSKQKAKTR